MYSNLSGTNAVGQGVDMLHADTFTNVCIAGLPIQGSGGLIVQVQTSDTDVAGNYTDPTSGLAQLPTWFSSGGLLWINSGGILGGTLPGSVGSTTSGVANSGQFFASGFQVFAAFQRVGRFARANIISGNIGSGYVGSLSVGFVGQLRTTGSGGGFTWSPGSGGAINV